MTKWTKLSGFPQNVHFLSNSSMIFVTRLIISYEYEEISFDAAVQPPK